MDKPETENKVYDYTEHKLRRMILDLKKKKASNFDLAHFSLMLSLYLKQKITIEWRKGLPFFKSSIDNKKP